MTRRLAREEMSLLERLHAWRLGAGPFYAGGVVLLASVLFARAPMWPWTTVILGPVTLAAVAWSLSRLDGFLHEVYSLMCIAVGVFFVWWARQLPIAPDVETVLGWSTWLAWLFGSTVFLGIGWWSSKTKRTEVHLEDDLRGWQEVAANFGLGKTTRRVASRDGEGNETGFLVWPRGVYTTKQVMDARDKLEGAMGLPEGSLRLMKHGRDTDRVDYIAFQENPLKESQLWPGPQQAEDGGDLSVDVPCEVGPTEDHQIAKIPYVDRSNHFVGNKLMGGTQGSGKSGCMTLHIADLACRSDASQWGMDMKGGAEITPWDSVMDAMVTTPKDAVPMIEALDAVMNYREKKIVEMGRKSWPITPEYPLLVIWIDELQRLLAAANDRDHKQMRRCEEVMVRLATTGRALGIAVNGATQNPTLEATKTSQFRDRMNQRICFRTEKENHEDYILNNRRAGSHLLDSSASGLCFVQDRDKWTGVPVRYYYVTDEMVEQVAAIRAPGLPLDEGSAAAAAAVWPEYAARIAERYEDAPETGGDASNVTRIADPIPDGAFEGPNVSFQSVFAADEKRAAEESDKGYVTPPVKGPNLSFNDLLAADAKAKAREAREQARTEPAPAPGEESVLALLRTRGPKGATAKELFEAAEKKSSWFHTWKKEPLKSGLIVQPEGSLGPYVLGEFVQEKVSAASGE